MLMNTAGKVAELVGNLSLVRLSRLIQGIDGSVCGIPEFCNPARSAKDRIVFAPIDALQASGHIGPQTVVIVTSLDEGCLTTRPHAPFEG